MMASNASTEIIEQGMAQHIRLIPPFKQIQGPGQTGEIDGAGHSRRRAALFQ